MEYHHQDGDPSPSRRRRLEDLENENRRLQDGVVRSLLQSNELMARELELLNSRLSALETAGAVTNAAGNKAGGKSIKWAEEPPRDEVMATERRYGLDDDSDRAVVAAAASEIATVIDQRSASRPPPMRKIKFLDHHIASPDLATQQQLDINTQGDNGDEAQENDAASFDASSSSSSSSEVIAFSGWARVFFQARHHQASTQITSSATASPSQDTYLHLSISSTSNVLRISDTDDANEKKPPLIDPPIPLKFFHAVKVPGSHSGAALFLKNDSRRLRKYIFRFEFVNRAVHQPPQRYIQFLRSGNAAKKSMRSINKMKRAFNKGMMAGGGGGEERKENLKEDKKKATDAFAAHLSSLDELLRESNDLADRFVDCVNSRNEEEEEIMSQQGGGGIPAAIVGAGGSAGVNATSSGGAVRRSRPPPPYWGSGFNRPSINDQDDDIESDSDFSDDDEELYYDDDNDDETLFDKVQVSTEQTLETLWNHIVK